mgnify:CR=1 FL=1|jgi:hypothetical protein
MLSITMTLEAITTFPITASLNECAISRQLRLFKILQRYRLASLL